MNLSGVSANYAAPDLLVRILEGLRAAGVDPDAPGLPALAAVEEFHIGGRAATAALVEQLGLEPGMRVLDVGCGIGGTARYLASTYGVEVLGVDLTPDFVETATELTRRVGLAGQVSFRVGDASALDVPAGSFDRVVMLHVGMNVADKPALIRGLARMLAPGGMLAVYDVMRVGAGPVAYPTPWAGDETTSWLASPQEYRQAMADAGLEVTAERDRREVALAFFAAARQAAADGTAPVVGLGLVIGPSMPTKFAHLAAAVGAGVLAPVELVARLAPPPATP